MNHRVRGLIVASAVLSSTPAFTQTPDEWTYRLKALDEVTVERANDASPFLRPGASPWARRNLFSATADTAIGWRDRVKFGAGVAVQAADDDVRLRAREAYGRWSAHRWLDVEAGRRIVRWGTGYGFTPTGLLDPPRDATDPQDRLGLNEGTVMVKADVFAGPSSVTLVAAAPRLGRPDSLSPPRLFAARIRTTLRGVEMAIVGAAGPGAEPSWGANFTHVVGDRFEWHGEWLAHGEESPWRRLLVPGASARRTASGLIGLQYTFGSGVNLVLEYYRDGNGINPRGSGGFREVLGGSAESHQAIELGRPTARHSLFARIARGDVNARFSSEVITILDLADRGAVVVPSMSMMLGPHVQAYALGVVLTGPKGSLNGSAPMSGSVTTGVGLKF